MSPGHSGEFRISRLVWFMKGQRHSNRQDVKTTGYRAELDKSATLRFLLPLMAATALPQHGRKRKRLKPVTHSELATIAGYRHRNSYTRNAGRAIPLVRRLRDFATPNHYAWAFGEGRDRTIENPEDYVSPTPAEMAMHPELGKHWKGCKAQGFYDWAPGWIYDPKTPGGRHEKAVLTYLAKRGLFAVDSKGHCKGEITDLPQETIATAIGICVDTVRTALRFWSDETWVDQNGEERRGVGLLRIIEQPGFHDAKGSWQQPPNRIIYLPARVVDQEQAVAETNRFLAASAQLRSSNWWGLMARIHGDTLKEWTGTERQLKTFWAECRRRMHDRGIPADMIGRCLPRPPG